MSHCRSNFWYFRQLPESTSAHEPTPQRSIGAQLEHTSTCSTPHIYPQLGARIDQHLTGGRCAELCCQRPDTDSALCICAQQPFSDSPLRTQYRPTNRGSCTHSTWGTTPRAVRCTSPGAVATARLRRRVRVLLTPGPPLLTHSASIAAWLGTPSSASRRESVARPNSLTPCVNRGALFRSASCILESASPRAAQARKVLATALSQNAWHHTSTLLCQFHTSLSGRVGVLLVIGRYLVDSPFAASSTAVWHPLPPISAISLSKLRMKRGVQMTNRSFWQAFGIRQQASSGVNS